MIPWDEILPSAVEALRSAPEDATVLDVVEQLRESTGYRRLTYDSLKHAMRQRNLGSPSQHLGRGGRDTERAPAPTPAVASPDLQAFVRLAIKGMPYRDICNALDISPARCDAYLQQARESGYQIDVAGEHVGLKPMHEEHDPILHLDVPEVEGGWFKVGVISDTHFGSKHCAIEPLRRSIQWMQDEHGIETVLFAGDLLDGVNAKVQWEQYCHSFDDQVAEAIRLLPRGPRYIGIYGNHDAWHSRENGMNMGVAITTAFRAAGRNDLELGRSMRRDFDFDGVIVRVEHPNGGTAYAKSYQAQCMIRGMGTNPGMPHISLAGHRHSYVYALERGVRYVDVPCFQWPTSDYSKRNKNGETTVGGLVIAWQRGDNGSVRRMELADDLYYHREPANRIEARDWGCMGWRTAHAS